MYQKLTIHYIKIIYKYLDCIRASCYSFKQAGTSTHHKSLSTIWTIKKKKKKNPKNLITPWFLHHAGGLGFIDLPLGLGFLNGLLWNMRSNPTFPLSRHVGSTFPMELKDGQSIGPHPLNNLVHLRRHIIL